MSCTNQQLSFLQEMIINRLFALWNSDVTCFPRISRYVK